MDKEFILAEIKRTADANGGKALGYARFRQDTGIKQYEWGKYWASWSDAVREAGLAPNELQSAYDQTKLLDDFANLAREVGGIPSPGQLRVRSHGDPSFPNKNTFGVRFSSKADLVKQVAEHCRNNGMADVAAMCDQYLARKKPAEKTTDEPSAKAFVSGYVYLMRSGKFHKIGRTNASGRRERELAIQLPDKATTVHVISTDDPAGIEAYWHRRFAEKRKNGEWFDLDAADVAAFKRRKFM